MVYTGFFTREPPTWGTKHVGEALTWATIRLREYRDIGVDRIQVEIRMQIGQFMQALSEKVVSPLPECVTGMDIMSDWEILSLSSATRQRHVNAPFKQYYLDELNGNQRA